MIWDAIMATDYRSDRLLLQAIAMTHLTDEYPDCPPFE
jgi:hypothetical protein